MPEVEFIMEKINFADLTWVMIATALVMIMTPTLAFFYGGLVRKKNVLSVLMQCMVILCVISIQWILFGYSLAFGPDKGGIIGGLEWLGLNGVGMAPHETYMNTVPHQLFMAFQMMFAVITPALILGAFVERIKFSGFIFFIILWTTLVYDPLAHWVWAKDGWLNSLGALDFAGGTVIHLNAGISALIFVLLIGKRHGIEHPRSPHNLPFAVLGAGFLWFGWFGFNAGSAGAANTVAVSAFINTNTAAAAAGLTWMVLDRIVNKVPTMLGVITGLVAGLVAVTPASGFVTPLAAMAIGTLAGFFCFLFVAKIKGLFGYDDSLDVFGVHGIGGLVGALATGLFATKTVNAAGNDGLFYGNPHQLWVQFLTVIVAIAFSAIMTFILFKIVDAIIGLRVEIKDEHMGLDLTQQHETAYTLYD
ncbi:MAG: ammonia channel protein [Spirochaetes bacterium RBG_16_49_21]|nr:MAG: ammonia channel protein [Spirochaetes bacterium RBG_16_49_21]